MVTGIVKVKIYVPWVHSLKEKRMVVKSILSRVRNKFNVSIAEVDAQDFHQSIVLGFACVTTDNAHADKIIDTVIKFMDDNTDGEIVHIERELY